MKPVELIGAQIGEGAPDPGCRAGARVLRDWGLAARLTARGRVARWSAMVGSDAALRPRGAMAVVEEFSPRLARAVSAALTRDAMPVVVGGDHSCAVGTWSAVASALRPRGALGLVWIDAHLDSHTPDTSHTLAPHGMPLAALLGHGRPALTKLCDAPAKVQARDVAIVGARSWEAGEAALLARLGVRVFDIDEVRARGMAECLREAVARVTAHTAGFGLSFDLDALDPQDAPGTGTPVDGGIRLHDAVAALARLAGDGRLMAAEIAEYDPRRDPLRQTAVAADAVLGALLAGCGASRLLRAA